ncbi:DedA family protein [Candidatus Collierbacteria bacterium]|nr:DedA family protein [Candidatus Collierbacteria bacterium]
MVLGGDLQSLIESIGYLGIFGMTFAESGLFFGFFLPGDSLLFTAGLLASQKIFNIWVLLPLITLGAIGGDSVGFWTGKKFGDWLMKQKESFFFQKKHMESAKRFYDKHGGKTLILARFIPAIRTFAPIIAGMADMHYGSFITYNVFGGLLWSFGMTLLGYYLGTVIPDVDKYLLPIIGIIILLSVLPAIIHFVQEKQKNNNHE